MLSLRKGSTAYTRLLHPDNTNFNVNFGVGEWSDVNSYENASKK